MRQIAPRLRTVAILFALISLFSGNATVQGMKGQATAIQNIDLSTPLTLRQAIEIAIRNYPSLRAARAKIAAGKAGVGLAKTAYLPRWDVLLEVNRATHNNITGLLLTQPVISSVTGPVQSASGEMAWQNAEGTLLSWEPFDFGLRKANVNVAGTEVQQAIDNANLTEFEVASNVAETYLKVLTANEMIRTAAAYVARGQVLVDEIRALTENGLRPEADLSRAEAELATARIQLSQAKENRAIGLAVLAQQMGLATENIPIRDDEFLTLPVAFRAPQETGREQSSSSISELSLENHPALILQQANIDIVKAKERSLAKTYFPHFYLEGMAFGRGSGFDANGNLQGGLHGLYPTRGNYTAGLTMTFSIFDLAALHQREKIEKANEEIEKARYEELMQEVAGKQVQARALLESALEVARETPIKLKAARDGQAQFMARYRAGLMNIVDIANAQQLLAQAESEDALARLGIWQAILKRVIAQGNLQPFLKLVSENLPGGDR